MRSATRSGSSRPPGVEAYRGFAQAAASELTAAGLASINVAPGQFSDPGGTVPANTIYIGAFISSPCGSGGGIAGCGGPYLGKSRAIAGNGAIVLAGQIWILPPDSGPDRCRQKGDRRARNRPQSLGLAHYSGSYGGARQVMYPSAAPTASYQAGDRNGLSYLRGENPVGELDAAASPGINKVRVTGWSFDPDQSAATTFTVTVDGARAGGGTTSLTRADVNARYGVTGSRGFDMTVTAAGGLRQVCVTATNYPVGNQQSLGCRTVVVTGAAPEGSYDTIAQTPGHSITVTGWALDRDNLSNSAVTLTIDGTPATTATTNQLRTDINTKYATTGTRGFTLTAPTTPGTHTACVTTPDYPQLTSKTTLGCRTIRIP
ncbi:hypothetical protein ATY41_04020 [Leifsonia xyli subsp. xyli]|nr:hypothetical protein [Leifsonia xyli]ODA89634.1 hypothetical protein ATY41_04020 [Leifsonia xyli subsp. xyli]